MQMNIRNDTDNYRARTGESLRQKRLAKGLSMRETAIRAGISHTFLLDIEKGRRGMTDSVFLRILKATS